MKQIVVFICTLFSLSAAYASHIVGGEVFYSYLGAGSSVGNSRYSVSLRLFRECDQVCGGNTGVACLPESVTLGIFSNQSPYNRITNLAIHRTSLLPLSLTQYPSCISGMLPDVCYEVATYTTVIELEDNAVGYRTVFQTCCRAASSNVLSDAPTLSNVPGATYECVIPGTNVLPVGEHNNSAVFQLKDTVLVCNNAAMTLNFSAVDADNDSLSYEFQGAYDGGSTTSAQDVPPGYPPYNTVHYNTFAGFTASNPLGNAVSIDAATGIISGISPGAGEYVVCVLVKEWRHGIQIAEHRKDFIMVVNACSIPQAALRTEYINCDTLYQTFQNETTSSLIHSYYWDFGVPSLNNDTAIIAQPAFTYPDTGTYQITLIVNKGEECTDTAHATVKIYPGFSAGFEFKGSCFQSPYTFTDTTVSAYGTVNNWFWNFGDETSQADTSHLSTATYLYPSSEWRIVQLIVQDDKGCKDTVQKSIQVLDKPLIYFPFKDTLICHIDSLQLQASADVPVSFSWQPAYNILNATSSTPIVFPKDTTTYKVTIDDGQGCTNTDSVIVNVIDKVSLSIGADTTICLSDSLTFYPQTNALYFQWFPASAFHDNTIKNNTTTPFATTTYSLTASVGKCSATDAITVKVSPYPQVNAGLDTTICYGRTVPLSASVHADTFFWQPASSLLHAQTLTPVAGPPITTFYTLTVRNDTGCLKPVEDTVMVKVIPPLNVFAGNDTMIVANQPLQLQASGADFYNWTPATGLNASNIANPILTLNSQYDTVTYRVIGRTVEGCYDTDSLKIIIFKKSIPQIYVPTGFTPNADGRNDILKPIMAGIKQLQFFSIYNRWGEMVYTTSAPGAGWDGVYKGKPQPAGTYVFVVKAIDYLDKPYIVKGTVVLIR